MTFVSSSMFHLVLEDVTSSIFVGLSRSLFDVSTSHTDTHVLVLSSTLQDDSELFPSLKPEVVQTCTESSKESDTSVDVHTLEEPCTM